MKKKLILTVMVLFALTVSFSVMPKKANAIPAFAQKYHYSCAVCHTVFPNLNPFGRAFWRNGFRLPSTNGTPADATQIANGLSLPNPWPIPVMIEGTIGYQHYTNENVSSNTDAFSAGTDIVAGGAFKLYTPLANSLSFYIHYGNSPLKQKQVFASINGLLSGFGIAPHLVNLKAGQVTTASPYMDRQEQFYIAAGPTAGNIQNLSVGADSEADSLIHARNAGFALYGTPGYHLWYKLTVTNDAVGSGSALGTADNAMEYSYQLREYLPVSLGQLELGYYGATVSEPIGGASAWTNRVMVNGVDADLANNVYELGLAYMTQSDSNPYANYTSYAGNANYNGAAISGTSNGYSTFEIYGRYILPVMNNGIMLSADYGQYSWTHKTLQEAYNASATDGTGCTNLYQTGSYTENNGGCNEGIQDALDLQAEINLAYNAHLYLGYVFTNKTEDNTFGTGLDFAF